MLIRCSQQQLAEAYQGFAERIYRGGRELVAADAPISSAELPSELEIQQLWAKGLLISCGLTERHGPVRILDVGQWNRGAGADFRRAEIEIGGETRRGDIEIDPQARDWERHGHGTNPDFNEVVLHVVLSPPPGGWFTRDSQHRDIPVLYLPPSVWQAAMGQTPPPGATQVPRCAAPLLSMPLDRVCSLLQAAAAHRMAKKRRLFRAKAAQQGEAQTWYEALAETLGYSANKAAMRLLAARAPLSELAGRAEAVLFGVAGFLLPVLPEQADAAARAYHRRVWDAWWPLRQDFALSAGREIPWHYAATRPQNHPHRRVAALAAAVQAWERLSPLFNAAGAQRLSEMLAHLQHPYWDTHYTLPSAPARNRMALLGASRINDFLVNHVYVQDESAPAWHSYLAMKTTNIPGVVSRTAARLFGERADVQPLLRSCYVHQALLQIDADFCAGSSCRTCLFPEQLAQWQAPATR